ncbi:MAG: hypothetical protein L0G99_01720 [Propionibacteriales bacterium]|nr:hypothetical protein [Propionibacteriales bacterium]
MNLTDEQPQAVSAGHVPSASQAAAMRRHGSRLLAAGFIGAHVLGILTIIVLAITLGTPGAISGALGVVVVLMYRLIGQMISNSSTRLAVGQQMATAMGSLILRVTVLLVLVAVWLSLPAEVAARFEVIGIASGVLAAELGWLAALMITGLRTRMPIYDPAESAETPA